MIAKEKKQAIMQNMPEQKATQVHRKFRSLY